LDYKLLFRWFVGLSMDEMVWNHVVFSKNRKRLLNQELARVFFEQVLKQAKGHSSDEQFNVDGALIVAWASQRSFQKKDGGDDEQDGEFHGQKRTNETHESKTDCEARLYRKGKGQGARIAGEPQQHDCGRAVDARRWNGRAQSGTDSDHRQYERNRKEGRTNALTLGADKAYDMRDFVNTLRELNVRRMWQEYSSHRWQCYLRAGMPAMQ
jgi:hypothetical protein